MLIGHANGTLNGRTTCMTVIIGRPINGSPMAIRRFYCENLSNASVELHPDDAVHARKVLRLAVGHTVHLFDGRGTTAEGTLIELTRRCVVDVTKRNDTPRLLPGVDVAVALPKGSRADVLVEKLSELGADRIIPLITERTVVEPRPAKLERYERMAIESAKQCGRAWLMQVSPPTPFDVMLRDSDHDTRLIADMQQLQPTEDQASKLSEAKRVLVMVGPEGGWTDNERTAARDAGFTAWCFAPYVLRVETAAIAATACIRQQTFWRQPS